MYITLINFALKKEISGEKICMSVSYSSAPSSDEFLPVSGALTYATGTQSTTLKSR